MNDVYMFRIVSGLYDVPLDDPNPRFGQQRRKEIDPALLMTHSLIVFTLDFKANFKVAVVVSKSTPCRVKRRHAARAATPEGSLARARARDHAHRRGLRNNGFVYLYTMPRCLSVCLFVCLSVCLSGT
jgi:hypothetical protein